MSESDSSPNPPPENRPDPRKRLVVVVLATFAMIALFLWSGMTRQGGPTISYTRFKQHLAEGAVRECQLSPREITGWIAAEDPRATTRGGPGGEPMYRFRTVRVDDPKLVEQLEAAGVEITGRSESRVLPWLMSWIVPIGLLVVIWIFLSRRMRGASQGLLNVGKSQARLVVDTETGVTFQDVAGCDEAKEELCEVVDFLQNPESYQSLGAVIPKGVLLVGPPGTGKTLLARAVAGEASVPFFSLSGSEFVEMFVGVGAARVRSLFAEAKKQAPCIVFIDELDAVGRQRGVQMGAVNDEREQTLNQLLVEMDGFDTNTGVILLAATNRPEILDQALLRPGRFDRQVLVDAPDREGRQAILDVHARNKPLADDVNLERVAKATSGFSGADLANSLNEAALLAARRGSKEIVQKDLEEAVEKVVAGPERKSRRLAAEEKRRVAYHEVGHALVSAYSTHADPVQKISIVPRGKAALGYTLQFPEEEHFLLTRSELRDRIRVFLGGRAAEEMVFEEVSTGAENDLERATALAQQMVCAFGMSDTLGLAHSLSRANRFLDATGTMGGQSPSCSDETAKQVDDEVRRILNDAYREAKEILSRHRDRLELVTRELLETEVLDGERFKELLRGEEAVR